MRFHHNAVVLGADKGIVDLHIPAAHHVDTVVAGLVTDDFKIVYPHVLTVDGYYLPGGAVVQGYPGQGHLLTVYEFKKTLVGTLGRPQHLLISRFCFYQ